MVTPAELSTVGALHLGPVRIDPGLLELSGPIGRRTLEPRVMQVLVELLRAGGRPLSREALSLRCWRDRIVGEDALNRAVAKVRRDLAATAGEAVQLETIRGVGYRLHSGVETLATLGVADGPIVPAIDLETRALAAMFEGTRDGFALATHYLKQAVAERPMDAALHGSLAMAHVLSLSVEQDDAVLTAARARDAALRAQALNPAEGRSLAALASLEPTFGAWASKSAMLHEAAARAPAGTAPLIFQRVLYLASVGDMAAAAALVEPLAAAAPLVPWIQAARAQALAAIGRLAEAVAIADAARSRWPQDRLIGFAFFHLALAAGQTAAALEHARAGVAGDTAEQRMACDLAETLAARDAGRATRLLDDYDAVLGGSQTLAEQAILAAAHLRDNDRAMQWLHRLYGEPIPRDRGSIAFPKIGLSHAGERSTALLFLAPMQAVRRHPSFPALVASLGLPMAPAIC